MQILYLVGIGPQMVRAPCTVGAKNDNLREVLVVGKWVLGKVPIS